MYLTPLNVGSIFNFNMRQIFLVLNCATKAKDLKLCDLRA